MLTSKQLIEQTGISRATLNNYIAMGILEKPLVQRTKMDDGRSPRLGYFPDAALERINEIQELKKEGLSMTTIVERLQPNEREPDKEIVDVSGLKNKLTLEVSIDDIPGPAYMVNNNFELVWWNEQAVGSLFGQDHQMQADVEDRNIIRLLMELNNSREIEEWKDLLTIHLEAAKKRISHKALSTLYTTLTPSDAKVLDDLYESVEPISQAPAIHFPIRVTDPAGNAINYNLYACFFREGVLFAYAEANIDCTPLIELLSRRDHVIRDLLKKRKPFLTPLSVMVADLQNSVQICAELPPDEYFELINNVWQASEPIFRKYYGTHGKHVGDGMVYYFFPQPDCNYILNAINCAHEIRNMMTEVSRQWQKRKNWLHELYLNIGLDEGQEWFGTYHSGSNLEFTVLGDTINHAARISDYALDGSIWLTKKMLANLTSKERSLIRYGIRRRTEQGDDVLVKDVYSRVSEMVDLDEGRNFKFHDIATLPITEIIDITINQ
jgi:adenylate cyclase